MQLFLFDFRLCLAVMQEKVMKYRLVILAFAVTVAANNSVYAKSHAVPGDSGDLAAMRLKNGSY
jgi:hypothetical protein